MSYALRAAPPPLPFSSLLSSPATLTPTATTTALLAMSTAFVSENSDGARQEENGECRLLGPFAILIQSALGALALLSLVYKRWRERPQRPVKIWAFDASKQVVGSVLLHLVNLAMSELSSGAFEIVAAATKGAQGAVDLAAASNSGVAEGEQRRGVLLSRSLSILVTYLAAREDDGSVAASKSSGSAHNPCSFYLLNLAIDTTLGIPILIVLLRLATAGFLRTPLARPPESIKTGNYGRPPRATWWLKQCLIYFVGLLGMKLCVFGIFQLCPWLGAVGDWALRWTEGDERLQIFFVMLFFPLVMNALQYYIIDGFIKEQTPKDSTTGGTGSYEEIRQDDNDDEDDEDGGDASAAATSQRSGGISGGRKRFAGSEDSGEETLEEGDLQAKGSDDLLPQRTEPNGHLVTKDDEYDPRVDRER